MRKFLKILALSVLGLLALLLLASAVLYAVTAPRLVRSYSTGNESLTVPAGADSVSRGRRLLTARCPACHGENLEGMSLFDDPVLGRITAPNITGGRGADGAPLAGADYLRAVRHGIRHDGRPLLVMPSEAFYYLNDADLADMLAYLKTVPPSGQILPGTHIKPVGVILIGAGVFGKLIAAEDIDYLAPRPSAVQPAVTAAYGDYLVRSSQCRTCHGPNLTGGKDPDPAAPPAPDLTPAGELSAWTEADFLTAMRTGLTPGGHHMNDFMPWKYVGQLTDDELKAVWLYLRSLPEQASAR